MDIAESLIAEGGEANVAGLGVGGVVSAIVVAESVSVPVRLPTASLICNV